MVDLLSHNWQSYMGLPVVALILIAFAWRWDQCRDLDVTSVTTDILPMVLVPALVISIIEAGMIYCAFALDTISTVVWILSIGTIIQVVALFITAAAKSNGLRNDDRLVYFDLGLVGTTITSVLQLIILAVVWKL